MPARYSLVRVCDRRYSISYQKIPVHAVYHGGKLTIELLTCEIQDLTGLFATGAWRLPNWSYQDLVETLPTSP